VLAGAPDAAEDDKERHLDALIANAKRLLGDDYAWVHNFALTEQLGDGRDDLAEFGVHFDHWFSERSLFDTGLVDKAVANSRQAGHLYEQDGAKWFRSTAFGDEKDRVVQRENGLYTYFASDIAYHLNKYERGFERIIDIWGADHHGYIPRVKGALAALGLRPEPPRSGAGAVRGALPRRPEGLDVHPLRRVRHPARAAQGSRQRRLPLLLRAAQVRPAPRFRPRPGQEPEQREPGVLHPVRPRPRVLGARQWGGDEAIWPSADLAPLDNERELALCARLAAFPETVQNAAATTRRTRSPST
jgi:arginyl-tRNA synthetase